MSKEKIKLVIIGMLVIVILSSIWYVGYREFSKPKEVCFYDPNMSDGIQPSVELIARDITEEDYSYGLAMDETDCSVFIIRITPNSMGWFPKDYIFTYDMKEMYRIQRECFDDNE